MQNFKIFLKQRCEILVDAITDYKTCMQLKCVINHCDAFKCKAIVHKKISSSLFPNEYFINLI